MKKFLINILFVILCFNPTNSWSGVDFDDVDDFLNCGSADILPESAAWTVSAWLNLRGTTGSRTYLAKRTSTTVGVAFTINASERVAIVIDGNTDLVKRATPALTAGTWTHVLVTGDGSSTATNYSIFYDGTETAYTTNTDGDTPGDNAAVLLQIGRRQAASQPWDGQITEVAIWNVEFDVTTEAAEIALLASSRVKRIPLQVKPSNLQAYWPVDECADGVSCDSLTFNDLSGNGNTCTGDNGGNNTGLTGVPEAVSSY